MAGAEIGVDRQFQQEVRDMVQPGTSALFLIADKVTPDEAIEMARSSSWRRRGPQRCPVT